MRKGRAASSKSTVERNGLVTSRKLDARMDLLLAMMDDVFDGRAWHGPTLRGVLRGLSASDAARRPARAKYAIAEWVMHCAYWKYAVRRRLRGDKRGSFPLKGSNWIALPTPFGDAQWRSCIRLLDDEHAQLRKAVAAFPASRLNECPAGSKVSNARLIYGIVSHDVYHTGQIRLVKAMLNRKEHRS